MVSRRSAEIVVLAFVLTLALTACPPRSGPTVSPDDEVDTVGIFNQELCTLVAEAAELRQQIGAMDGPPTEAMRQRMVQVLDAFGQLQDAIPREHPQRDRITSRLSLLSSYRADDFQLRRLFINFAEAVMPLGEMAACAG